MEKERRRKRRLLTGWASARGLKLPGDWRGFPLWLGPPGWTSDDGEDGLARDSSAWRLAAGGGERRQRGVLSLGGAHTLLLHWKSLGRVPPHKPLHLGCVRTPLPRC